MAALTQSGVTINDVWVSGPGRKCVDATLVLSTQGGLTNSIAASLLGMRLISRSSIGVDSVGSLAYPTAPSYDRTLLCTYDVETSTDADRANPVDISATIRVVVEGLE